MNEAERKTVAQIPLSAAARTAGRSRATLLGVVVACVAVIAAATAVLIAPADDDAAAAVAQHAPEPLHVETAGDLRYTFHAVTGIEALYDVANDPNGRVNLAEKRPDDTQRLRKLLLQRTGARNLDSLQAPFAEEIERLKALGYL